MAGPVVETFRAGCPLQLLGLRRAFLYPHSTTRQQTKQATALPCPTRKTPTTKQHTKPPRIYRNPGGTAAYPKYRYTQRCIYPLPRHQGVRALRGRVPCRSKEDNMHLKPKSIKFRERKNPADSEESAGFSLMCAPWDSNPEPID